VSGFLVLGDELAQFLFLKSRPRVGGVGAFIESKRFIPRICRAA